MTEELTVVWIIIKLFRDCKNILKPSNHISSFSIHCEPVNLLSSKKQESPIILVNNSCSSDIKKHSYFYSIYLQFFIILIAWKHCYSCWYVTTYIIKLLLTRIIGLSTIVITKIKTNKLGTYLVKKKLGVRLIHGMPTSPLVAHTYSHFFLPDMFQACSFLFLWLLLLPVCATSGEVDIPWISRTPSFFYQICSKLASLEHIW
jgi:hypothetical protein